MKDDFYNKESLARKFVFTYDDYMELLELDDLLLKQYDSSLLIDNPYILFSISYLKTLFSDYYDTFREADDYLYSILLKLSLDKTLSNMDLIAINETMELFNRKDKAKANIITFPGKK